MTKTRNNQLLKVYKIVGSKSLQLLPFTISHSMASASKLLKIQKKCCSSKNDDDIKILSLGL